MRLRSSKLLGILPGSLHIILYFVVPVYASNLDKLAPDLLWPFSVMNFMVLYEGLR